MREKLIALAISTYTKRLWERDDITFSEHKVKEILKEVELGEMEERAQANWEFIITLYEEAKKTADIDVFRTALYNRLKHRKYMTEGVVRNLLEARFMKSHESLKTLHDYMNNEIKEGERKKSRLDILHYTAELVSYYEASKPDGIWSMELIKQEIESILDTHYKDLKIQRKSIEMAVGKRQVGKVETLKAFEKCHRKEHEVFASYLKAYIPELNKIETTEAKEMTLEDSLEDLLNEMGLGGNLEKTAEQAETEKSHVAADKKDSKKIEATEVAEVKTEQVEAEIAETQKAQGKEVQEAQAAVESSENVKVDKKEQMGISVAEATKEELSKSQERPFLCHMSEMAQLLGYDLHKLGDKVIPEAYYNTLMEEKENAKMEIWRNLARVDHQAVLSELYNAYQNLEEISKGNLEAILGNFFSMLALEGIEVVEEDIQVGDHIKVHTKDVMKDFILAAPTQREGELEGTVLYKAWQFKGKTMMPKVIKVKEEM